MKTKLLTLIFVILLFIPIIKAACDTNVTKELNELSKDCYGKSDLTLESGDYILNGNKIHISAGNIEKVSIDNNGNLIIDGNLISGKDITINRITEKIEGGKAVYKTTFDINSEGNLNGIDVSFVNNVEIIANGFKGIAGENSNIEGLKLEKGKSFVYTYNLDTQKTRIEKAELTDYTGDLQLTDKLAIPVTVSGKGIDIKDKAGKIIGSLVNGNLDLNVDSSFTLDKNSEFQTASKFLVATSLNKVKLYNDGKIHELNYVSFNQDNIIVGGFGMKVKALSGNDFFGKESMVITPKNGVIQLTKRIGNIPLVQTHGNAEIETGNQRIGFYNNKILKLASHGSPIEFIPTEFEFLTADNKAVVKDSSGNQLKLFMTNDGSLKYYPANTKELCATNFDFEQCSPSTSKIGQIQDYETANTLRKQEIEDILKNPSKYPYDSEALKNTLYQYESNVDKVKATNEILGQKVVAVAIGNNVGGVREKLKSEGVKVDDVTYNAGVIEKYGYGRCGDWKEFNDKILGEESGTVLKSATIFMSRQGNEKSVHYATVLLPTDANGQTINIPSNQDAAEFLKNNYPNALVLDMLSWEGTDHYVTFDRFLKKWDHFPTCEIQR